jgi:hypothetical protein
VKRLWRLWAKAIGQKEGSTDREADYVALIRTFIVLIALVTNIMIASGIVKHWNDAEKQTCEESHGQSN